MGEKDEKPEEQPEPQPEKEPEKESWRALVEWNRGGQGVC